MIEDTPTNQIKNLEEQVRELSRKVDVLSDPTNFPEVFLTKLVNVLVRQGFLRNLFDIITYTNPSGKEFHAMMTEFRNTRGLVDFIPQSQLIPFTVSTSNLFTSINSNLFDGAEVGVIADGGYPSPLNNTDSYYIIDATRDTFKLSTTVGGAEIDITTIGSKIMYLTQR